MRFCGGGFVCCAPMAVRMPMMEVTMVVMVVVVMVVPMVMPVRASVMQQVEAHSSSMRNGSRVASWHAEY